MIAQVSLMKSSKHKAYINETISYASLHLQDGQQTRELLCPECGGGHSKERSFAIRKEGGTISYRCWRASCGLYGRAFNNAGILQEYSLPRIEEKQKLFGRPYQGAIRPVNADGEQYFEEQFGLAPADLAEGDIRYNPETNRYIFPVHSPRYEVRGYSLRTFDKNVTHYPKWDHYPNKEDINWLGWHIRPYVMHEAGPIVVVEDPISSLKVSRQFVCTYLNGTSLNYEKLAEILKVGRIKGICIALDKDATSKAIDMLSQWSFYLGGGAARAVPVEQDLKYVSDAEISKLFKN